MIFKKITKWKYKKIKKYEDLYLYKVLYFNIKYHIEAAKQKKINSFSYFASKYNLFRYLKINFLKKPSKKKFFKYKYYLIFYFLNIIFINFNHHKLVFNNIIYTFFNLLKSQFYFNLADKNLKSITSFSTGLILKVNKISLKNLRRKQKGHKIFLKNIYTLLKKKKFSGFGTYLIIRGKYLKTQSTFKNIFLQKAINKKILKIIHNPKQPYGNPKFRKIRSIKKRLRKRLKKSYISF